MRKKSRTQIIQDMQLCTICSPGFDRAIPKPKNGGEPHIPILAHQLGLHVRIEKNGAECEWAPMKGHSLFEQHKTAFKLFGI